jgi:hypothetical protein
VQITQGSDIGGEQENIALDKKGMRILLRLWSEVNGPAQIASGALTKGRAAVRPNCLRIATPSLSVQSRNKREDGK